MNEFNLDKSLKGLKQANKHDTPDFFTRGIDEVLTRLPEQTMKAKRETMRKKWSWLHTAAALMILAGGTIFSGFASPVMASVLMKIPGLHFIYSASYEDVAAQQEDPHLMRGLQFHFGENGPFQLDDNDVVPTAKFFDNYDELKQYVGMDFPQLPEQEGNYRVNDYGGKRFDILIFGTSGFVLNIVPNALNLPQFEGQSVHPVINSTADLNGIQADVLSYQFSKTNPSDRTSYVTWKRNEFTFILAAAEPTDKLIEVAKDIDNQALELKP